MECQRADGADPAGSDGACDVGEERRVDVPAALQPAEHQHVVAGGVQRAVDAHHALVLVDVDQAGERTGGSDVERRTRAGNREAVDGNGRIERGRAGGRKGHVEIARRRAGQTIAVIIVGHETARARQAVGQRRSGEWRIGLRGRRLRAQARGRDMGGVVRQLTAVERAGGNRSGQRLDGSSAVAGSADRLGRYGLGAGGVRRCSRSPRRSRSRRCRTCRWCRYRSRRAWSGMPLTRFPLASSTM